MKTITLFTLLILTTSIKSQITHFEAKGYTGLPINGGGAWEVIPFDIDADNDLDIIVLRAHEYDEIYINDGQGSFTLQTNLENWQIPGGTFSYAKADLNNDGFEDLILGRGPASGSSTLSDGHDMILIYDSINNGFVEKSDNIQADELAFCVVNFESDKVNYTMGVATGDFNQDGIPDFVMANGGIIYQIDIEPLKPFDGQWAFCSGFRNKLLENNLYLGRPDGSIFSPTDGVYDFENFTDSSNIGQYIDISTDIAVGDYNGDGLDDIFITNFHDEWWRGIGSTLPLSSGYSKLFINDSLNPGHFTWEQTMFPTTLYPATSVASADFDKDGDLDLFITMESRARIAPFPINIQYNIQSKLFLNDGLGNFTEDVSGKIPVITNESQKSLYDANFVDVNSDGWLDIFCAGAQNILFIQSDTINHLFTDMTNNIPLQNSSLEPYTFHAYGSTVNDFNGDSCMDIIMVDTYEQNRLQTQGVNGKFTDITTNNLAPDGENNTDVVIGDLDNDGDMDIISAIYEDGSHLQSVHIQTGSVNGYPKFDDLSGIFTSSNNKSSDRGVEIFDLNGDNLPEVLFTGYNGWSRFYNNNGGLNFTDVTNTIFPNLNNYAYINLAKIDTLNSDGDIVIFLPTGIVNSVNSGGVPDFNGLYRWNGTQFINTNWIPNDVKVTSTVDFADLNNDGWKDILVVNENDKMDIYMSQNPTTLSPNYISVIPSDFVNNQAIDAKFVDLEGDGDWDIIENTSCCAGGNTTNNFTVYLNDGSFSGSTPNYTRISFGGKPFQGASLDVLDLDNDGNMDVVLSARDSLWFYKWDDQNNNMIDVTSAYTDLNNVSGLAISTYSLKIFDINQDGLLDIYLARDNQDLLLYGQGAPLSITEFSNNEYFHLKSFPNPTQDGVVLEYYLKFPKDISIEIIDMTGRIIFNKNYKGLIGKNKIQLNIANLQSATYFLKLVQNGRQETIKIIKME